MIHAAKVRGSYGHFGCIQDPEGRLLLVQRGRYYDYRTGSYELDGRWNYPGGGVNEDDVAAAHSIEGVVTREVQEETGLLVRIADFRPVGVYPTANHNDIAVTWFCKVVGGELQPTAEGTAARYFTPYEIMELARTGDVPGGLVGGLKTSTGGIPRHIQMCLHFFTRVSTSEFLRQSAEEFCLALGIPR